MKIPQGMEVEGGNGSQVLKLIKNLYGLKQASHNWYTMIKNGLMDRGFEPSEADPCMFIKEELVVVLYVDDMIVVGKRKQDIEELYNSLKEGNENFKLTKEGKIDKYLGVELIDDGQGSFEARQPHLIKRIIEHSGLEASLTNSRPTPATLPLLYKDLQGTNRKYD